MLFNSAAFLFFFTAFFPVYWLLNRDVRWRNAWTLAASYFFYACWDWRFLFLLMFSTLVDYCVGRALHATPGGNGPVRRRYLVASLVTNLGILGTFKYFGFFVDSFVDLLAAFGIEAHRPTLNVVLPVGISFYTFQSLSYTIDIYRGRMRPARNLLNLAAYVSFFPQLVAGPIERSGHLLPQIESRARLTLDAAVDGGWLILWGLVKKMLVADRVAVYVNTVFATPDAYSPATCLMAVVLFAVQIYCDFSGYSDIARGTAKLLGIDLMVNFRTPYFATSLRDFWHRWHISLSTWFRDYLFIPLGGSKGSPWLTRRNILATFIVSGLWHGAAYTYLIWGALHGIGYLLDPFSRKGMTGAPRRGWASSLAGWACTFAFVNVAWVFFRASSLSDALTILGKIASPSAWLEALAGAHPALERVAMSSAEAAAAALIIGMVFVTEWIGKGQGIDRMMAASRPAVRWGYSWLLLGVFLLMPPSDSGAFIYFQF